MRSLLPLSLPTLLTALAFCAWAPPALAQDTRDPLAGFPEYAAEILESWGAPGLAVAVVKDGRVVMSRGFGSQIVGGGPPVDEHTLFSVASTTKAFTAATVGLLVDQGLLSWDDPVVDHLPGFTLADPWVTREITIRDLLSHRSGVPRADHLWYLSDQGRDEVVERAGRLPEGNSFRNRFGYQNVMFITAGEVVEAKTGESWDQVLARRIFEPLGMTRSTTLSEELRTRDNVATPHVRLDGGVFPIAWPDFDNVGAAGAIKSSVHDMARWMRVQLGEGSLGEDRLWSDSVAHEMWSPNTVVPLSPQTRRTHPETNLQSYALGWYLQDYRGELVVRHSGSLDGMRAHVALVPSRGLGVVALTNLNEARIPVAVVWDVIDRYLPPRETPKNWSRVLLAELERDRAAGARAEARRAAERVEGTRPTLPLEEYVGEYEAAASGRVEVALQDGELRIRYGPNYVGMLEHWHFDSWRIVWRDRALGTDRVTFYLGASGTVETLELTTAGAPFRRR